jgi:phosphoribosylformylglycinamidine (FGAM) synthase-like amidotransferase family enzyme
MDERGVLAMSIGVKALVLAGDGINCDVETAEAFRLSGFTPDIRHINDLISEKVDLDQLCLEYRVIALPGGFSFGDDIASGKILALKIKHQLRWDLSAFVKRGGLVIGVCNGFQALIRLGIFGKELSITNNRQGKFINRWVRVQPYGSKCVWLKGLGIIDIPIRHGEGRIVFQNEHRNEIVDKMHRLGNACLKYIEDPNGSEENLAGLCDISGRILGLMPHPEAYVRYTAHPEWTLQPDRAGAPGEGLLLFENAFQEAKNSK